MDKLLSHVLDEIEQQEARLLSWGIVDISITKDELFDIVGRILETEEFAKADTYPRLVIQDLVSNCLIFDIGQRSNEYFRSRMAETVRLLFHSRQLFSKNAGADGWQSAPNLVADFRFIWQRRTYPSRDVPVDKARSGICETGYSSPIKKSVNELVSFNLAAFQVTAAKLILKNLIEKKQASATLVSAGTGSGKTLAFYIPVLARIVERIVNGHDTDRWVKALALYPRVELLKDQFSEVYKEARKLDGVLAEAGRRKIIIGALFGPVPNNNKFEGYDKNKWKKTTDGLVCDFIRCPTDDCKGDMVWKDEFRTVGKEKLHCSLCESTMQEDEIILTRSRLEKESPDIFFTTTEMMNQRLGDSRFSRLFGIGTTKATTVETLLFDEVHTYTGQSGAQTAFLIRRWRKLLNWTSVAFVGLSATIRDGEEFFAQLTGLNPFNVIEIKPTWRETIREGAEYLLALRGDPVSRTALLSTTIQSAMIISRSLDNPRTRLSEGVFGTKSFIFGDDIDVIQRLFHALNDAEGRYSPEGNFNNKKHPRGGLAHLRQRGSSQTRYINGQDWRHLQDIGHACDEGDRKSVARVMSLDPGVEAEADVVVASASLEVGYNDPNVGAVIQHKAPREPAQFIQRKGRAGRKRGMRPWTVVNLTDYGKDRLAYQSFDLLFDPELPPKSLPISSRYIKRMQTVHATFDYLSQNSNLKDSGSVWTNLSGPTDPSYHRQRKRQEQLYKKIQVVLDEPEERQRLVTYISQALAISNDEVQQIVWEQPRPLFLEVLPTALRRLETNWVEPKKPKPWEVKTSGRKSPLPEFIPGAFHLDLDVTDVQVLLRDPNTFNKEDWSMNSAQLLRDFTPFRVSKRYAFRGQERHWVGGEIIEASEMVLDVENSYEFFQKGIWKYLDGKVEVEVVACQPVSVILDTPPVGVTDTSNARPIWRNQIISKRIGDKIKISDKISWHEVLDEFVFHTHRYGSQVEVRRMSLGSSATLKYKDGRTSLKTVEYQLNDQPCVLGFNYEVDAVRISIKPPFSGLDKKDVWSDNFLKAVRTSKFFDLVKTTTDLDSITNPFLRDWLANLAYSAVTIEAMKNEINLHEAVSRYQQGTATLSLKDILELLFQSKSITQDIDRSDDDFLDSKSDTLRSDLQNCLDQGKLMSHIWRLMAVFWDPIDQTWEDWLNKRYVSTVAAGIINAVQDTCPEFDAASLAVDLHPGVRDVDDVYHDASTTEIWISEKSPGGIGQIEDFFENFISDPRKFFDLLNFSFNKNELVEADYQIQKLLDLMLSDSEEVLVKKIGAFRQSDGLSDKTQRFRELTEILNRKGLVPFHAFNVALANRVLKAGSSEKSDTFLQYALKKWDAEELRLGVEIDARLMAYRLTHDKQTEDFLSHINTDQQTYNDINWRFGAIYGLLWPRGGAVRKFGLSLYSPYTEFPEPDPILIKELDRGKSSPIDVTNNDWLELILDKLAETGTAILGSSADNLDVLVEALNILATNPVQSGYISVYARVGKISKLQNKYQVTFDIAEVLL